MSTITRRTSMLFPPDLWDALEDLAAYRTCGVSAVVRMACVDYIARSNFPRRGEEDATLAELDEGAAA